MRTFTLYKDGTPKALLNKLHPDSEWVTDRSIIANTKGTQVFALDLGGNMSEQFADVRTVLFDELNDIDETIDSLELVLEKMRSFKKSFEFAPEVIGEEGDEDSDAKE